MFKTQTPVWQIVEISHRHWRRWKLLIWESLMFSVTMAPAWRFLHRNSQVPVTYMYTTHIRAGDHSVCGSTNTHARSYADIMFTSNTCFLPSFEASNMSLQVNTMPKAWHRLVQDDGKIHSITGPLWEEPPETSGFPLQRASNDHL